MNMTWRRMGLALCTIATLTVANAIQAQSRSAATPVKTATATTASAKQTDGPDALFTQWDTNHDRMLSPAEFNAGWQGLQANAAVHRLHEQFAALDTDKSGSLDAAEYAHLELIKHAGASAPPMSAFDADKNQRLDFKEYVNVVNYMLQHERK